MQDLYIAKVNKEKLERRLQDTPFLLDRTRELLGRMIIAVASFNPLQDDILGNTFESHNYFFIPLVTHTNGRDVCEFYKCLHTLDFIGKHFRIEPEDIGSTCVIHAPSGAYDVEEWQNPRVWELPVISTISTTAQYLR